MIYFGREWVMLIQHAFERDAPRIQLVVSSYVDSHSKGVYKVVESPTHQLTLPLMTLSLTGRLVLGSNLSRPR